MAGHRKGFPLRMIGCGWLHLSAADPCPFYVQRKGMIMKLNHVNLYSHDILADRAMFESYFGLRTLVVRAEKMVIMQDDDGLILIVNHFDHKLDGFEYPHELDILHIGFIQKSREAVDDIYVRLIADGWQVQAPRNFHGAWAFYLKTKGGYFIEVATLTPIKSEEDYQGKAS
ncbi:VOC family protein [Gluconacetobacter sacchari]|uniref:VOC family protein n=1 Tax=Gluconacetobacter sacchari TaxID=92759 RepID=UPI0039B3B256